MQGTLLGVDTAEETRRHAEDAKRAAKEIKAEYISIIGEDAFKQLEDSIRLIISHCEKNN